MTEKELTKDDAFNAIVEGMKILGWDKKEEEDNPEEFMEEVYKKELGSNLETVDSGVAVGLIDFTQDSEYRRLYESQSDEETLERKGGSPPSTETSRQNTEGNKC